MTARFWSTLNVKGSLEIMLTRVMCVGFYTQTIIFRTLKGWKPRRLGGGFGGKKESGQLRFGGIARPFKKPYEIESSSQNLKEIFRQQKNKK